MLNTTIAIIIHCGFPVILTPILIGLFFMFILVLKYDRFSELRVNLISFNRVLDTL